MNKLKLKCLFGYHNYTIFYTTAPVPFNICSGCGQFGYRQSLRDGLKVWYTIDVDGEWAWYKYQIRSQEIVCARALYERVGHLL